MTAPENIINDIIKLLKPSYKEISFKALQSNWQSVEKPFFKSLFNFLPQYQNSINKINFIVTHCGTTSQFNALNPHQKNLTIYCRSDATIRSLCQVIILSLIRSPLGDNEHRTWSEIESISDFILNHTSVFTGNKSTSIMVQLQQKQAGKLYLESQKFQTKIGIPLENKWRVVENEIFYQDIKLQHLTTRQSNLLKLLIKNQGAVVSNDQIAELLWPLGENFSLWAIVKEIARIRQCIKLSNLPTSLLQSHRKLGYSLT